MQVPTVPKRIVAINEMISERADDPRKKFIQASPFRGLLHVKATTIYSDMIIHLLSNWDVEKQCFILKGGQRWEITDDAVARVYGLPYGETKENIQLNWNEIEYEYANTFLQEQGISQGIPVGKGNLVLGGDIYETLYRPDLAEESNAGDFWRLYVLYALCFLLVPNSTSAVSGRYLRFLQTPQLAARYNWGALVRDILQKGINDFSNRKSRTARPNGDLYCLVNMFMDKLNHPRSALRGFTCAINSKTLTREEIEEAFPGHDEEEQHDKLVVMEDIPPHNLTRKQKRRFLLDRIERLQELHQLESSPSSSEEEEDDDTARPKRRLKTVQLKRRKKTSRPKKRAKESAEQPLDTALTVAYLQPTAIQAPVHDELPLQTTHHVEEAPSDEQVAPLHPEELPPQLTNHEKAPVEKIDEQVASTHPEELPLQTTKQGHIIRRSNRLKA